MALGKLQKMGIKQMTRGMVDKLGDTPAEKEVKDYWYEINKEKVAAEDAPNPTDLSRLDEFAKTPRATDSEFVRQTIGKPPMFGKDKWVNKTANALLVYSAVVQAHHSMYKPGNDDAVGAAVYVISIDPKHVRDIKYLRGVAEKISAMKTMDAITPEDMQYIMTRLCKDEGDFCGKVGASIAGDDNTWCGTYTFPYQRFLPTSRIPDNHIVPFILDDEPRQGFMLQLKRIPREYYS